MAARDGSSGRFTPGLVLYREAATHDSPMANRTMQINLTGFGVMGEDRQVLEPSDNPHTVSEHFGRQLIYSGRAVEHAPSAAPATPPGVQRRDPKASHRDPR